MREALAAEAVIELFATAEAMQRHPELVGGASEIAVKDAAALSETVSPQGLIAVCRLEQPTANNLLATSPGLIACLVEPHDPGNLGTVIRTADAAGADAVIVAGGVDVYNGKAVRASAGSLFHLPVIETEIVEFLTAASAAGMTTLATTGHADRDLDSYLDDGSLARPTVWMFGTESHGLPESVLDAADAHVRIPIHGWAESLNLAASAAICLYASARARRHA